MASLVPPFNCPSPHQSLQAKPRALVNIRVQCMSYQMTAVIDFEKIQLPTLESHVKSFSNSSSSSYVRAISLPTKGIQTDFELLINGEEETIAAAAAEAVALAKAALDVAKHAAQMKGSDSFVRAKKIEDASSEFDQVLIERVRISELESQTNITKEQDEEDDEDEDDEALESTSIMKDEEIDSERIIVRSNRQSERRDRRSRIATKDANNVISVKSGSTGRKKKASLQEVDYSDPLRYLRATTSSTKLLTVSEELELSEGIQEMIKLEKLQEELTERFGSPPSFAQWAAAAKVDQKTLRKRLNYGKHCKDRMIKSNIRLVISIAKNFQGAGMNLQDLVQEGCRGLVKGAEKFDASKGFKFSTYAHWWIKQAVRRSLSEQSRTIRLPFHMVEATYRVREARKQLYSENGKYPDNEELAKEAGLTMKRFTAVMLAPKAPRSLDQKYGIDMSLKPSEVIADPEALTSEEILIKQIVRRDLNKVLDSLSPREKQVIKWRFGLGDGRMKTLQEIGEAIGVSRERIRQIESCAFRKLKNKKRTKNLRQHLIT